MHKSTGAAFAILALMALLMVASSWNDSAIMDELAHIPAGFGYVAQGDYRLNPEHPPLVKALSALSAQILTRPRFPTDIKSWRDDINGQWLQGAAFLYGSGNDADRILFWARLPVMALALLLGWLIFRWTRRRFGTRAALPALIFYAFSPTVLAHARFVTTDLGAAFGFFIGIVSFIAFLERPDWRHAALAGLAFGIAQLMKFSLVLLIPIDALILLLWIWAAPLISPVERVRMGLALAGKMLAAAAVALAVIWTAYAPLVRNYPPERQVSDAEFLLGSYGFRPAARADLALMKNSFTRPLGQYLLGVLMVQQRSQGGNTSFFLGEVSGRGSPLYFPLLYLVKEPLVFHILALMALLTALGSVLTLELDGARAALTRTRAWIALHIAEASAIVMIAVYWILSIKSPLNIGVRHVLPTFPFIYILVARALARWIRTDISVPDETLGSRIGGMIRNTARLGPRYLVVAILALWIAAGTALTFPHFLSYYNELAGGAARGWKIAVDSNYDWGQDLKRLGRYAAENRIDKIALDYFGGGAPPYYLGGRYEQWWSSKGAPHGYFAISATFRQGAWGTVAPGGIRRPEDSYEWLRPYEPVDRVGSIFVYKLP